MVQKSNFYNVRIFLNRSIQRTRYLDKNKTNKSGGGLKSKLRKILKKSVLNNKLISIDRGGTSVSLNVNATSFCTSKCREDSRCLVKG